MMARFKLLLFILSAATTTTTTISGKLEIVPTSLPLVTLATSVQYGEERATLGSVVKPICRKGTVHAHREGRKQVSKKEAKTYLYLYSLSCPFQNKPGC